MMFLDLQFKCRGILRGVPLMTNLSFVLTRGHCLQPTELHFCPFDVALELMLRCLFWTIMLPIDPCFLMANITRVLPIRDLISSFKLKSVDLNSFSLSK